MKAYEVLISIRYANVHRTHIKKLIVIASHIPSEKELRLLDNEELLEVRELTQYRVMVLP